MPLINSASVDVDEVCQTGVVHFLLDSRRQFRLINFHAGAQRLCPRPSWPTLGSLRAATTRGGAAGVLIDEDVLLSGVATETPLG